MSHKITYVPDEVSEAVGFAARCLLKENGFFDSHALSTFLEQMAEQAETENCSENLLRAVQLITDSR